jgi:hypothetical protein
VFSVRQLFSYHISRFVKSFSPFGPLGTPASGFALHDKVKHINDLRLLLPCAPQKHGSRALADPAAG